MKNMSELTGRWHRAALRLGCLPRNRIAALLLLGLCIRVVGLFGLGDADVEHFKAWTTLTLRNGLERAYSVPDAELLARARERNVSLTESFNSQRTWVTIEPLAFSQRDYMVVYPPGSVYPLYAMGLAYRLVSPELRNTRLFNAFLALPMLLASIGVTWLIYVFFRAQDRVLATASALLYWLNPIVMVDSTIQGYNNPLVALLNMAALVCLYRRKYFWAVCATVIGVLTKPQAVLLVPIVAIVCLRETPVRRWVLYAASAVAAGALFLFPFVRSGYTLSALLGSTFALRSLDQWSTPVLSPRTWNLWWPLHVATYNLFGTKMVQLPEFQGRFGINVKLVASIAMILICGAALVQLWRHLERQRIYIFLCMILLGSAYTMVQVNVQFNQFFVFIPMLWTVALLTPRLFSVALALSAPWLVQLLTYGGLGRDACCVSALFERFGINSVFTATTLLVALLNVVLWLGFIRLYFNGALAEGTGPDYSQGEEGESRFRK